MKKPLLSTLLSLTFLTAAPLSHAAITFTFTESGGNVIATATGSVTLPTGLLPSTFSSGNAVGDPNTLFSGMAGDVVQYDIGGTNVPMTLGSPPDIQTFGPNGVGFAATVAFFGSAAVGGMTFAPTQTYTWTGTTIASIFGSVPSSTITAFQLTNFGDSSENRIDFAFAPVPESSRAALVGVALFALVARRRRF